MFRALLGLPVHLCHGHLEVLLGRRFLPLVHTGRRTGIQRETVLEVIRYESGLLAMTTDQRRVANRR